MRKLFLLCFGLFLVSMQVMAQARNISGRVTDDKGNGLANASVIVKGTNIGTSTSADGSFSLSLPSNATALVISYIGLSDREVVLTNESNYSVALVPGVKTGLDEVVVVAYGTQQRRKVTGAVSNISGREEANIPMTSVDQTSHRNIAR